MAKSTDKKVSKSLTSSDGSLKVKKSSKLVPDIAKNQSTNEKNPNKAVKVTTSKPIISQKVINKPLPKESNIESKTKANTANQSKLNKQSVKVESKIITKKPAENTTTAKVGLAKPKNNKKATKVAPAPVKTEAKIEVKPEINNKNKPADKPQKELKLVLKTELESKDKQEVTPVKPTEKTAEPKTKPKNNKKATKVAPAPVKTEAKVESKPEIINKNIPAEKPQKELKLVLKTELESKDKQDIVPAKTIEKASNNNQNNAKKPNTTNNNINKNNPKIKENKIDIDKYFRTGEYIINSKNDTKQKNNIKNNSIKKDNNEKQLKINTKELVSIAQSRDPYFKKIFAQIENFIDKELYLDDKIKIVIGVSGGVDSTVLFDILSNISVKREYTLFVAHVDHSLRKESEKDTEYVKNLCAKYNVKFFTKKINVKEHSHKKKISIEEAARDLRYEFLEEVCAKTGANFLALAHNSNDSAETFFINLLRGTGLSGLSGIPQKRPLNTQVNIIRPVINLSRAEIEEYAKKRNIQWVEDTSNKENIYLRNKIRNELLPFIQEKFDRDIIGSISKASKLINGADVFIYHKIKKYLNDVLIEKKTSYVEIDLKKLFLFDDFVKGEIINLILKNIFEINNISQNIVKGIINLYFSEPGAIFEINSKITCYKDRNSLFIARKQLFRTNSLVIDNLGEFKFENSIFKLSKIPKNKVQLGELPNIEYFDLDYMPDKLEIRHIQDGDKFTPIGMTGRMKVSDFLVNNKIPLLKKKDILLLTDRVNIVWVCGLRIADKYKITPSTKKVLKVEIIEKNA